MGSLDYKIGVDWGYCPCYINGKKALFHKWVDGQLSSVRALVEFEDGAIYEAQIHEITFCDNLISEYAFPEEQEDK